MCSLPAGSQNTLPYLNYAGQEWLFGWSYQSVICLPEEHLTQNKMKRAELHYDLDALCGSWTENAAAAFDRSLAKQRAIDLEVWK